MADTSQIKLLIVLDKLGLDLDMTRYDFRLRFQKIIYLCQDLFNLDINFNYSWYIRGPYSKGLADAGYDLAELGIQKKEEMRKSINVNTEINKRIAKAVSSLQPHLDQTNWLELAASINYLRTYHGKEISLGNIKSNLLGRKPEMKKKNYNGLPFDVAFREVYNFILENES